MKKRETRLGLDIELEDGDLPESAYTHRLPVGKRAHGWAGGPEIEISRVAVEILGSHGKLLALSKSSYVRQYPDNAVYFNACIFVRAASSPGLLGHLRFSLARWFGRTPDAMQIWFGDLDLTAEGGKLQQLADRIGEVVVTPEYPYRFDGLPRRLEGIPRIRVFRPRG